MLIETAQVQTFQDMEFFQGLDRHFVEELSRAMDTQTFEVGEDIIREGEAGCKMYVLVEGSVDVVVGLERRHVIKLHAGNVFGEMALFGLKRRCATVEAAAFCDCRAISLCDIHQIFTKYPQEHRTFLNLVDSRRSALDAMARNRQSVCKRASVLEKNAPLPVQRSGRCLEMRPSECLSCCPLFVKEDSGFMQELVLHLEPEVFEAGDVIMREGEEGFKIYFISAGIVDVLVDNCENRVSTLEPGCIFGEMTLFGLPRRTATVRALQYCLCYVTGHQAFFTLLQKYPSARRAFMAMAQERKRALLALDTKDNVSVIGSDNPSPDPHTARTVQSEISWVKESIHVQSCISMESSIVQPSCMLSNRGLNLMYSSTLKKKYSGICHLPMALSTRGVCNGTMILETTEPQIVSSTLPSKLPHIGFGSSPPWHIWGPAT